MVAMVFLELNSKGSYMEDAGKNSSKVQKIKIILNDLIATEDAPPETEMEHCKKLIQDYFFNKESSKVAK